MTERKKWTSDDLEMLPYEELKRYEIIDGELYASDLAHLSHQAIIGSLATALERWNGTSRIGQAVFAPGLIFSKYDDVVPDVVWMSNARLADALDKNGHLRVAPELIAEVLMPCDADQRRDREAKLLLYSRCNVLEYWIVNWTLRCVDVYRREQTQLHYVATLSESDTLESPSLPGFSCPAALLFERIPASE